LDKAYDLVSALVGEKSEQRNYAKGAFKSTGPSFKLEAPNVLSGQMEIMIKKTLYFGL